MRLTIKYFASFKFSRTDIFWLILMKWAKDLYRFVIFFLHCVKFCGKVQRFSAKFPYQKIKWNYGVLWSAGADYLSHAQVLCLFAVVSFSWKVAHSVFCRKLSYTVGHNIFITFEYLCRYGVTVFWSRLWTSFMMASLFIDAKENLKFYKIFYLQNTCVLPNIPFNPFTLIPYFNSVSYVISIF